jgi:hypothetical protein
VTVPQGPLPSPDGRHPLSDHTNGLVERVRAGLAERQHLLGRGFDCHAAARRIADRYLNGADGASGFWIARARWTAGGGQPTGRAIFEVLRSDGRVGVWDAVTLREGEEIADVLTTLLT